MIDKLLVALIFFLVVYDAKLTARRINEYGESVEVNLGLRWLSKKTNPEFASFALLLIPNLFWAGISYINHWSVALGLLAGFKLRYWFNQLESVHFEKEAKEIQTIINSRPRATQPSSGTDANASPSQAGPPSWEK